MYRYPSLGNARLAKSRSRRANSSRRAAARSHSLHTVFFLVSVYFDAGARSVKPGSTIGEETGDVSVRVGTKHGAGGSECPTSRASDSKRR